MRFIFRVSAFLVIIFISGCSFFPKTVDTDKYKAAAVTSSGLNEQRQQMMLFNRQLSVLHDKLRKLETERNILLKELETVRIEANGLGRKSDKSGDIKEYQAAIASSQTRTAETQANATVKNAEIESEIDAQIASIEASSLRIIADLESNRSQSNQAETTKLIADVKAKEKLKIAKLNNSRRIQMANVNAKAVTSAASVVAPVLSEGEVYMPASLNANVKNSPNKNVVRKTREIFDVMYLFDDRKSWKHFSKFLSAHGVHDKFSVVAKDSGKFVTYVGRFYSEKDALNRKRQLANKTKTDHAVIRKEKIFL
jgi:hypothetical protein